jgi:hypothetical protein
MNHSIYIAKAVLSRFKSRTRYTSINPKFHSEFGIFLFLDESVDLRCEYRIDFIPQDLFPTPKIKVLFLDKSFDLYCESGIDFLPQHLFSTPRIRVLFLDEPLHLYCESSAFAVQIPYAVHTT